MRKTRELKEAMYPKIVGHRFTDQEIIDFWNDSEGPGASILFEARAQVSPGFPVEEGYWSGYQLVKLDNGDIIKRFPDDSRADDLG